MGNQQSGSGGGPGGNGGKKNDKEKKRYEPPIPTRVGKKRKRVKGPEAACKLPQVTPHTKCRLKLLKLDRIKDYLLMEEEFIKNQVCTTNLFTNILTQFSKDFRNIKYLVRI